MDDTEGGKSASPEAILGENFIFYHPYESIKFSQQDSLHLKKKMVHFVRVLIMYLKGYSN